MYSSDNQFVIDSISGTANDDQAFCVMKIELDHKIKSVRFMVDTGSQVNILDKRIYDILKLSGNVRIVPSSKIELYAYTGHPLENLGHCYLKCVHKDKSMHVKFDVMNTSSSAILELRQCLDFKLIKLIYTYDTLRPEAESDNPNSPPKVPNPKNREGPRPPPLFRETLVSRDNVLSEYKDVFEGIGKFPGECSIHPVVPPVIYPPRKVPFALHDELSEEISHMESEDIICTEPTQLVYSIVVVESSMGN